MAGGGGTRFWPLSRQEKPKQLLNLTGNDAMVNEAISRLMFVADKEDIFIVTNKNQATAMQEVAGKYVKENHILIEPSARNTAACIGYAAMEIIKKYGDGVMVITPSDAYIRDVSSFVKVLNKAVRVAEEGERLVTIGIQPTFPATGYGYIRYNEDFAMSAKTVVEFKEKPDVDLAKQYLASGDYVWNSGMFVWKASVILDMFKQYIPDIYEKLCEIGAAMGKEYEADVINEVYSTIRKISVDYAIMEPSAQAGVVMVVPGEFGWNDVGSWDMMSALHKEDIKGNILLGDTVTINTTNSILYSSDKVITTVGIDNLVIVNTPDAVMVCPKDKAQDVKMIVDALSAAGRTELL